MSLRYRKILVNYRKIFLTNLRKIFITSLCIYLQTKSTRQELRKQAEGMVKNMRKMVLVVTRS